MWTPTTGKLIDKRIKKTATGWYYPEITYTYSVVGTKLKNKSSMGTSLLGKARSAFDNIADEISLKYNPQNHQRGIGDQENVGAWDIFICCWC
jgi:hypothetical protein